MRRIMERNCWDSSYIEPYLKDWLKYARESDEAEQQKIDNGDEFRIPYAGVQTEMISAIFSMASRFEIEPHAKYMAVHLLDRYLGLFFWELIADSEITESTLRRARSEMFSQIKLVLVSCLQIASKVALFSTGLGIPMVRDILQSVDPSHEYTRAIVFASEQRILKTLDFRIPYSLPIDAVQLFLAYSELPVTPELRETCLVLLDVAYLRHNEIFAELHLLARGKPYDRSHKDSRDFLKYEVNAGFIAAAVVVCSNFFFYLKKNVVMGCAAKLAALIDMSAVDVQIMANILFTNVIDKDDFKDMQAKIQHFQLKQKS
ncbi:hypothetical protein TKK_0001397 [Trichogramma kaykai]|uniref:Cyclin N-terminal domain-containing protein n=1 Tax=Trichogramma kaykai TaxID=54128 RepID=A0ABD2X2A1_9HYME